jgi:membrane-associated phospholipid phosphatase
MDLRPDPDPRDLSPSDVLTVLWLAISLPLYILVGDVSIKSMIWAFSHPVLMFLIVGGRWSGFAGTRVGRVVFDFYPLILFAFLYTELAWLNRAFHPEVYFDQAVIALEQSLFGTQPAMTFREAWPWRPFGEYVQFCYFSYYAYTPLMVLGILLHRGRFALHASLGTLSLSYYLGFVVFILIPVAGPYYEFARMDTEGWFMPHLVQFMLDQGSAVGTAFPSSHVSIATTVWIMCMRYNKRLAWVFAFLVPGMAVGAIYGGQHYLIDVLAGAVVGILSSTLGHAVIRRSMIAAQDRRSRAARSSSRLTVSES